MKTSKKIIIAIVAVVGVAVIGVGAYWFSIPVEGRNMFTFMMSGSDSYENYEEYQVIERNDDALISSFETFVAEPVEGDTDVNIRTITEMVLNEDSGMMKIGMVDTLGVEDYTGWQVIADEIENPDTGYLSGPSPLSYYTTGLASNLHTQVVDAADVLNIDIDSITVEVLNTFYWDEMMTDEGTGNLGVSYTDIILESDASTADILAVVELALNSWAAGNALAEQIVVEPHLIVNGENFETYYATPGLTTTEDSFVGELQMTSVTDEVVLPTNIELSDIEEAGILEIVDTMNNLTFDIYAISESVDNEDRPYLNQVTVLAPSGETWVLYADEFMGEDDTPLAPTSLEYFTLGTSLCLTSQTTIVSAMFDLEYTDYRVEHMFEYSLEDSNTTNAYGTIDIIHTYVIVESDEDQETLDEFFSKALALCFAGEGLVNETEMVITTYLNGEIIE